MHVGCRQRRSARQLPEHTASVSTITGVHGETGAAVGTVDLSNTAHTNAGTYSADYWFFTGAANYNNIANTIITNEIDKANATFTVTPYDVIYNGLEHTASVSTITGVNGQTGATVGAVDVSHTTHTNAGDYSDFWSFTGAGNYHDIGLTAITDIINRAQLTVTANNDSKTFRDVKIFSSTAFTQTGLATANGDTITGVTLTSDGAAAAAAPVGTYAIVPSAATGTGLSNYDIQYVNGTLSVVPINVTARVRLLWPASYTSLGNKQYRGVFTITNTSSQTINGPIRLSWPSLPPGVSIVSSTSVASLAPGKSATIVVVFHNPVNYPLGNLKFYFPPQALVG